MKIRTGFVSNSSSSSFCIVGKSYETNDFLGLLKSLFTDEEWTKIQNKYDEYEIISEVASRKLNLNVVYDVEMEDVFIGLEPLVTKELISSVFDRLKKIDKDIEEKDIKVIQETLYC